jgi:molybdopterin converting factor small subunit
VLQTEEIVVEGETLDEALEDAYERLPALRVHLCDESGNFRPHVLCFLNDVNSRWLQRSERRLRDGDRITILQAVSGG